jgi:hypothetical protein
MKGISNMRKLTIGALALMASCGIASAADLATDKPLICASLLHFYPTDAPLDVALGDTVAFTCQPDGSGGTIRLPFDSLADLEWWATHSPDRVIVPGEGDDD